MEQVFAWGLPYLIGRLYLTDLDSLRELCLAIFIGGLIYVPLCWIEIRLSPQLERWVYGMGRWGGVRYGGYRPSVFLSSGLELGLWMALACLIGFQIWATKSKRTLWEIPVSWLVIVLMITTVFCKSIGALMLMVMGVSMLILARITKRSWPFWLLLAIPPFYCVTRTTNTWTGQEVVEFAKSTAGEERAQSFDYRLNMENRLATHALERPYFGWGRFNRSNLFEADGRKGTVQDGYWIIVLGMNGSLMLADLLVLMLLPVILTIRRYPPASWNDPQVGPAVGLCVLLILTMIDFLSNAMLNPIYALTVGALMGQPKVQLSDGMKASEESLKLGSELMSEGRPLEAAHQFHRAITAVDNGDDTHGRQIHAEALDGLGHSLLALGRIDEAENAFKDALMVRDWLAAHAPEASRFRDLAVAREGLARLFIEAGRPLEAVEERQIALRIWDILVAEHSRNADYKTHRVAALNDLAWLLATDPAVFDPAQALMLAEEALRSSKDHDASWNTLGVARYRTGDWAGAIEALERSALSSIDGRGTAFDHFFIAMAWARLQNESQAREWLERGVAWTARHRRGHPELERFRQEAESLLNSEIGPSTLSLT